MHRLCIVLAVFAAACVVFAQKDQCPEIDPEDKTIFLPHKTNCSRYYVCTNGVALCLACPGDQHFNKEKNICDWKEDAHCTPENIFFAKDEEFCKEAEVPKPSTTEETPEFFNAEVEEEEEEEVTPVPPTCTDDNDVDEFYPHEKCHLFYHCSNGVALVLECSPGLHFNPEKNVCDFPKNANCQNKQ